jgi:Protein of unknown function (DUF3102)
MPLVRQDERLVLGSEQPMNTAMFEAKDDCFPAEWQTGDAQSPADETAADPLKSMPDRSIEIISPFKYDEVAEGVASRLKALAGQIRRGLVHAVMVGHLLHEAKNQLGHGRFEAWLEAEGLATPRTAQRLMAIARMVNPKYDNLSLLPPPSVLYELASPSFPDPVRKEVLDRYAQGEQPGHKVVMQMLREAKEEAKQKCLKLLQQRQLEKIAARPWQDEPRQAKAHLVKSSGEVQCAATQLETSRPQEAEQNDMAIVPQQKADFPWDDRARRLIELLVDAVLMLEQIPARDQIQGLLRYCQFDDYADRLSQR